MNKTQIYIYIAVFIAFALMLLFNIAIYRTIVNIAIDKYIKAYLNKDGYIIQNWNFPGVFSSGAFKNEFLPGAYVRGWIKHYTYVDLHTVNNKGKIRKTTARISTTFFVIKKVEYKDYPS